MPDDHTPSLLELATRALRRAEHSGEAKDDRDAHLLLLARTIREQRARVSRRRWMSGALAVAAVIAVGIGLRALIPRPSPSSGLSATPGPRYELHVTGAEAEIVRNGGTPPAASSTVLHVGDRVRARASAVSVVVGTGTKMTLDPRADLAVEEEGRTQIFALGQGSMRADVAKLHEGERFLVRTADTEIEVRGTSFRVERADAVSPCRPELHTRVLVSEGIVVVRHGGIETRTSAGETWPAPCAAPPSENPPPSAPSSSSAPARSAAVPTSLSATSPSGALSASKLAASNELFAKAELARKSGDDRGAVALFDRLLSEYPSSPLVEHAMVERMRTLDRVDRARTVAAAREYLARFPQGFARSEAEAIVAIAP